MKLRKSLHNSIQIGHSDVISANSARNLGVPFASEYEHK